MLNLTRYESKYSVQQKLKKIKEYTMLIIMELRFKKKKKNNKHLQQI